MTLTHPRSDTEPESSCVSWSHHDGVDCLRVGPLPHETTRQLARLEPVQLGRVLPVLPTELLADTDSPQPHSMAGDYHVSADGICFIPRFPFLSGTEYAVVVHESVSAADTLTIRRPIRDTSCAQTRVVEMYPTARTVPRNALRVYVTFSGPMADDAVTDHVTVLRADTGELLDRVFLALDPPLWDPDRRRLTLLLDPGRIKRGLAKHAGEGYPLIEGVPVRVILSQALRDQNNHPLEAAFERRYDVGPLMRGRVEPHRWQRHDPKRGTRSPLAVSFDRPMDHALLQHSLWVTDEAGDRQAGEVSIGPGETNWCFVPEVAWGEGPYRLMVDARLEDIAGNSVRRVFDRDLAELRDSPLAIGGMSIDLRPVTP